MNRHLSGLLQSDVFVGTTEYLKLINLVANKHRLWIEERQKHFRNLQHCRFMTETGNSVFLCTTSHYRRYKLNISK